MGGNVPRSMSGGGGLPTGMIRPRDERRSEEGLVRAILGLRMKSRRSKLMKADRAACGINGFLIEERRASKVAIRRLDPSTGG